MKNFILVCVLMVNVFVLHAQKDVIVSGKVVDMEGEALIGVTVYPEGRAGSGTITDINGDYKLHISADIKRLVFSYIGMVTQKIPVKGHNTINVTMNEDAVMLDEVVAIGYGNVTRKDQTGAVSSVRSEDLKDVPSSDLTDVLRGRMSGVVLSTSDGSQEAELSVRVRGGISVTQDNSPLYIVDGLPVENALRILDANDIERIDVLKDAVSTAVYGAEGANGVIVITTKKGGKGKAKISYDTYWAVQTRGDKIPMLNAKEYALYCYDRLPGINSVPGWEETFGKFADLDKTFENREGIDWQDALYKTAISQQQKLTLSGSGAAGSYNISYTYNDDDSVLPYSGQRSHAIRSLVESKIFKNLSVRTTISYKTQKTRGLGSYTPNGKNMMKLINYIPTVGLKGDDEDLFINDSYEIDETDYGVDPRMNPYVQLMTVERWNKRNDMTLNASAKWDILKGLTYNIQGGYTKQEIENKVFYTAESSQAQTDNGPSGSVNKNTKESYSGNHTLTYTHKWENMGFDVMMGQELRKQVVSSYSFGAKNFPDENFGLDDFGLASTPTSPGSSKSSYTSASFFGRGNFRLLDKYLFTATFRADGSSHFGENNRWGYFPAFAFAWRAGEEEFIKNLNLFDSLKFRLSYGISGNNRIGSFLSLFTYASSWLPIEDKPVTSLYPTHLQNKDVKWEKNATLNVGVDMGLFQNRFSLTLDAYKIYTSDLLLNAKIPYVNGYGTCMRNVGKTESKGLEIGIVSHNVQTKKIQWTTNLNISFNKRIVKQLADSDVWEIDSGSGGIGGTDFIIREGSPMGLMYGFVSDGLYQADDFNYIDGSWILKEGVIKSGVLETITPGSPKYKNLNPDEDNIVDENDKTVVGDANPICTGGLMNTFTYKGFDLSLFCEFKVGGDIYNANIYTYLRPGKNISTTKWAYNNRYLKTNAKGEFLLQTGNVEELMAVNKGRTLPIDGYIPFDSSFVEDGSYLRFSTLTVGYTFPKKWLERIRVQKLRLYATAYNLGVLTGYSGYDPEVSMNRNNGLTPGIDRGSLPRNRRYIVGLNLTF